MAEKVEQQRGGASAGGRRAGGVDGKGGGQLSCPDSSPRVSRTSLRMSVAWLLTSCSFLRTRVPAALLPPAAFFTSSSASVTIVRSCS